MTEITDEERQRRIRGLQELADEYAGMAAKTRWRGARKDYQRIATAARRAIVEHEWALAVLLDNPSPKASDDLCRDCRYEEDDTEQVG